MIRLIPEPESENLRAKPMKYYRRLNPIQAMTFDLDDTFYANHPYIVEAEQQMFAFMQQHWPETASLGKPAWRQFRREVVRETPACRHDMIALRRAVLAKMFGAIGLTGDALADAISRSYDTFYFHRSHFKVPDEYVTVLKQLAHKVPLMAITNGNVDIARIGLDGCFERVYHASSTMRSKPFPDMFELACRDLKVPAQSILHVGDNLEKDVAGAVMAGFQAAWYAENRTMNLNREQAHLLPHIALDSLSELLQLI
ncbi:HAD-IA family hydrolase [Planctobacterium marinum]|uniref:HAD-IA family hydrolase n=2 Tax=Planctobacterium marinum TaxID=1631968 RepID=UPI00366F3517